MKNNELLTQFGFLEYESKEPKTGYLVNFCKNLKNDEIHFDLYFVNATEKFRISKRFFPSFLVEASELENTQEILEKRFKEIDRVEIVEKTDTKMKNHLNLPPNKYLRVYCRTEVGYNQVVEALKTTIRKNKLQKVVNIKKVNEKTIITDDKENRDHLDFYVEMMRSKDTNTSSISQVHEYDIPPDIIFSSENNIRCGKYYNISYVEEAYIIIDSEDLLPPELVCVAFDIETSKEPLKFPNAENDQIMMISLVTENNGVLIINKTLVKQKVTDFVHFMGNSTKQTDVLVITCENEELLLLSFIEQIYILKPTILTTYNGDVFDIPYIKNRMKNHKINYTLDEIIHLDCYKWVKRDSYLPMGSQGLKSVAKIKLGYAPDEVDPEEMMHLAEFESVKMASYSVSDSVATFELYKKYIHPFIFSLCTLIPLPPYDVLSKGSGTLCESLLIAESIRAKILIPPKRLEGNYIYEGQICNEVSYVGGHVECLKSGIFRSDFEYLFTMHKSSISSVKENFKLMECKPSDILSKQKILEKLDEIILSFNGKESINVTCKPYIYHLDVGAMYPNIILTNRLQPIAIVNQNTCINCDYFIEETNACQKSMSWKLRVDYMPPKREEINMLENALKEKNKTYLGLSEEKQKAMLNEQVKQYSKQIYKKTSEHKIIDMENIVCQRENSFYVDVVKAFRDKRYSLKAKHRDVKKKLAVLKQENVACKEIHTLEKESIIYESLQVAHKCVLNSFYGYVMRKNSRWYSMEMAAIVCNEGGKIIKEAKEFVDMIGITLELDTDGIWCFIPQILPIQVENLNFLCFYLNEIVKQKFTNNQYHELMTSNYSDKQIKTEEHNKHKYLDGKKDFFTKIEEDKSIMMKNKYNVRSVNEIEFEIDGPYKAMIIPASIEENKRIKKRYVIINNDNKITEIKGFESKRRGELVIVKKFQEELFELFYQGDTLEKCYNNIQLHCLNYLNIIETKGYDMTNDEIFSLFSESKNMSKKVSEYENAKSRSINTAKRLAEVLGEDILNEKGLKCEFIQSRYPTDSDIAERTLPIQVFKLEQNEAVKYLKKWTGTDITEIRDIMDWEYYKERLSNIILRMVVLPSLAQGIKDLIPGIKIPNWGMKKSNYGNLESFGIVKTYKNDAEQENQIHKAQIIALTGTTRYSKFLKQVKDQWEQTIQDLGTIMLIDRIKAQQTAYQPTKAQKIDNQIIEIETLSSNQKLEECAQLTTNEKNHIIYYKNGKILRSECKLYDNIMFKGVFKNFKEQEDFEMHAKKINDEYYQIPKVYFETVYKSFYVNKIVYDSFRNSIDFFLTKPKQDQSLSYNFNLSKILQPHLIMSFHYGSSDYYIHKQSNGTYKIIYDSKDHITKPSLESTPNDKEIICMKIEKYIIQTFDKPSIVALLVTDKNFNSLVAKLTSKDSITLPIESSYKIPLGGSIKEIINFHKKEIESILMTIRTKYLFAELFNIPLVTFLQMSNFQIFDTLFLKNCNVRLNRPENPKKISLSEFNQYFHKSNSGYYDSFVMQVRIKNLEYYCLLQNQTTINQEVMTDVDLKVFYTIKEMTKILKDCRNAKIKFKDEHGTEYINQLISKFSDWLFIGNSYVSHMLLKSIQSHAINYYFSFLGRFSELGAKVIMINKYVFTIDTNKKSLKACNIFFESLINEITLEKQFQNIELETKRIFEKIAIVDSINSFFILEDKKIRSFNQTKTFVKNFLNDFFSDKIDNAYFYNLLINRKYKNVEAIKNMLDVYQTRQNVDALRSSCYNIIDINEFEETFDTEFLFDIQCKECFNDNIAILTKLQTSNCAYCLVDFHEEQIYVNIVKYILEVVSERKISCVRCLWEKEGYLSEICKCGSHFKYSDLPIKLQNLILYLKNPIYIANVQKILSVY